MIENACDFFEKIMEQKIIVERCNVVFGLSFDDVQDEEVCGFAGLADIVEAGKEEGIYHFFNCSCGGSVMVISLHKKDHILLLIEGSEPTEIIKIAKQSYTDGIERSIMNIYAAQRALESKYNIQVDLLLNARFDFNAARHNYRERKSRT